MTPARPARARHAAPGLVPAGRRHHTPAGEAGHSGPGRHVARHANRADRQHPAHHDAPALTAPPVPAPVGGSVRLDPVRPGRVRRAVGRAVLATGAVGAVALPVAATVLTPTPGAANAEAAARTAVPAADSVSLTETGSVPAGTAAWVTAGQSVQDAAVGAQIAVASQQVAAEQAAAQAAAAQVQQVQAQRAADLAAAQAQASRSRAPLAAPATGDPRAIAAGMLAARGWGGQMSCLDRLWTKESGWKTSADNPSSDAYGIPQALPGSKMASAGADWRTNPATQIAWGLSYIASSYGSPCAAWSHSQAVNWY